MESSACNKSRRQFQGSEKPNNYYGLIDSCKKVFFIFLSILVLVPSGRSLNSEERGELARKLKYYHQSVRPSEQFNLLETPNGTFFRLITEIELADTKEINDRALLGIELSLLVRWKDDRLQLRELKDVLALPDEFQLWRPRIHLFPLGSTLPMQHLFQQTISLDPVHGIVTLVLRLAGQLSCDFEQWKVPFEQYSCELWFETNPEERLHLKSVHDIRPQGQMLRIQLSLEQWPWLLLRFSFLSQNWQSALVNAYLPSLLLFCASLLAQWKRRKVQVMVSMGSIALILIRLWHRRSLPMVSLLDLWLGGVFVHLICLLSVDLLLPARRVLLFKGPPRRDPMRQFSCWRRSGGSPFSYILHGHTNNGGSGIAAGLRSPYDPPNAAALYASVGNISHQYVSSPHLLSSRKKIRIPMAPVRGGGPSTISLRKNAISGSNLQSPGTGANGPSAIRQQQMARTYSVPPHRRRLNEQFCDQSAPFGGSEPLSRKRRPQSHLARQNASGQNVEEKDEEDKLRERAIASLLCQMESLRGGQEELPSGRSPFLVHGIGSQGETAAAGERKGSFMLLQRHQQNAGARPIPSTFSKPSPSSAAVQSSSAAPAAGPLRYIRPAALGNEPIDADNELGRLECLGIPRSKRLVLIAISMSFCLFICSYALLLVSATLLQLL